MTLDQLYAAAQQHVLSRNNPTSPVDVSNILLNYIAENGGSVDGTAINPLSIGATTPLASLHLANEAEIVAHEAGGAVQARLAYLNGYTCWVFMNPASGFSNIYVAGGYFRNGVNITGANEGYGIQLHGSCIGSRGVANTVSLSNGANAQTFEIYGTDTSSTNYERLSSKYDSGSGAFVIGTEKGSGGGSARPLKFAIDGTVLGTFNTSGAINFEGTVYTPAGMVLGTNAGAVVLFKMSDGVLRLTDWAGADFNRIQFGGTTSAFPAIKRSGAELQVRLADDSADAPITVSTVKTVPVLLSQLPDAATVGDGAHAFITDSNLSYNSLNIGSAVSGGGANSTPVITIGGAWVVG